MAETSKKVAEQEAQKRKELIDEMYGYTGEEMDKEAKDEFTELVKSYLEYRKNKYKKPLKDVVAK